RIWLAVRRMMFAKIDVWFSSRNVQKAIANTKPKYFARSPVSMRNATKFMSPTPRIDYAGPRARFSGSGLSSDVEETPDTTGDAATRKLRIEYTCARMPIGGPTNSGTSVSGYILITAARDRNAATGAVSKSTMPNRFHAIAHMTAWRHRRATGSATSRVHTPATKS